MIVEHTNLFFLHKFFHMHQVWPERHGQAGFGYGRMLHRPAREGHLVEHLFNQIVRKLVPPRAFHNFHPGVPFGYQIHGFKQEHFVLVMAVHDENVFHAIGYQFFQHIPHQIDQGFGVQLKRARINGAASGFSLVAVYNGRSDQPARFFCQKLGKSGGSNYIYPKRQVQAMRLGGAHGQNYESVVLDFFLEVLPVNFKHFYTHGHTPLLVCLFRFQGKQHGGREQQYDAEDVLCGHWFVQQKDAPAGRGERFEQAQGHSR